MKINPYKGSIPIPGPVPASLPVGPHDDPHGA
jgi:hypothetical protein